MAGPQINVDSIQDDKEGKPPRNRIDDGCFSSREELVDYGAKEQQVDERPETSIGVMITCQ